MSYVASQYDGVVRLSDGKFIKRNPSNIEWKEFLTFQSGGGVVGAAPTESTPYEWYIDVGPFFDRFGNAKMSVLASSNAVARAIVTDCSIRKWIDLKHPSVASGIDALIAQGIPGLDINLRNAIINTPVSKMEQNSLIKLYF